MRDWITKDLAWKLFSLILAVATLADRPQHSRDAGSRGRIPLPRSSTVTFANLPVLVVSASADVRDAQVVPNTVTVKVERAGRSHGGFAGQQGSRDGGSDRH